MHSWQVSSVARDFLVAYTDRASTKETIHLAWHPKQTNMTFKHGIEAPARQSLLKSDTAEEDTYGMMEHTCR